MRSERVQIRRLKREKAFLVALSIVLAVCWFRASTPDHTDAVPTRVFVCVTKNRAVETRRWALNDPAKANCEHPSDHTINWEVLP